jgi:hypothetical protein
LSSLDILLFFSTSPRTSGISTSQCQAAPQPANRPKKKKKKRKGKKENNIKHGNKPQREKRGEERR